MSEPTIREEQVLHAARLARLRLSPDEVRLYQDQLGRILEHVGELSGLDVSSCPETASLGSPAPLRGDEAATFAGAADLAAAAPSSEEGCFKVPKVIE
jgi:aspartyl-tRNA(Asn)/glutamyl-tRNA(Gln) amidotransferase subunit C